jgi:hypothetical protein
MSSGGALKMLTLEFRGRTEEEVEAKFLAWQRDKAGRVSVVKKHPVETLPLPIRRPRHEEYQPQEAADAYSMLVEYETKRTGRP